MNEEPIATKSSICKKLLILPEEEYSVGSWGHITTSSHHFRNFTVKTKTSTKVTLVTFLFFFFFSLYGYWYTHLKEIALNVKKQDIMILLSTLALYVVLSGVLWWQKIEFPWQHYKICSFLVCLSWYSLPNPAGDAGNCEAQCILKSNEILTI